MSRRPTFHRGFYGAVVNELRGTFKALSDSRVFMVFTLQVRVSPTARRAIAGRALRSGDFPSPFPWVDRDRFISFSVVSF
jgi:hypothetical protein